MSVRWVWRETTALFWEHPVLWLPILGADLFSFFLTREQKQIAHLVIYRLVLDAPSVLSGARRLPDRGDPSSHGLVLKAAVVGALFEWTAHFIQILLYTIALFIVVALVRNIQQRTEHPFLSAIQLVRLKWPPVFRLSLRVLGLVVTFAILVGSVAITIAWHALPKPYISGYVFACGGFCAIACLIAPVAMRRIAADNGHPPAVEQMRQGRIFALAMVITSCLLGYLLPYVVGSFEREPIFHNAYAVTALLAIGSLFTAAPYILLFISLTLIVDNELADGAPMPEAAPPHI
jgi:uncharacterized membrane protein YhaH (DUF805 family)